MARQGQKEKLYSTVLWRIENLGIWESQIHPNQIESSQISLTNLSPCVEFCKLSVELDCSKPNSCIKLWFGSYYDSYRLDFEWSIMDGNGLPILTKVDNNKCSRTVYMPDSPTYADIFLNKKSTFLPNGTFTVQLQIFNKDFVKAEHVSVVTRIEAPVESFVWRIERFSGLQLDEEAVTSVKLGKDIFKLVFSLRGESLEDADVNFRIVAENPRDQSLKVKLSLLDEDENESVAVVEKHKFSSSIRKQIWVMPKLMTRREILERVSDLMHGENLMFLCRLVSDLNYKRTSYIESYYFGPTNLSTDIKRNDDNVSETGQNPKTIVSTISKRSVLTSPQSLNKLDTSKQVSTSNTILGEDLMSAYNEQILNDFELRSGDVSFPVHKLVLSARSPVFKAMFCGDMKESCAKSMEVPDLDAHTIGRMLTFMYGGTLDDLEWESAAKLYYAADKYELLSLKQQCSTFLRYNITVSNVSDILELADRHQDSELTSHVHEFIGDHFKEVIASDEWDKFLGRSYLAGKTMKEVLQKSGFR